MGVTAEDSGVAILLGWTVWLYAFVPTLMKKYSESWNKKNSKKLSQHVAAYIRLSLGIILFLFFIFIAFSSGVLKAVLELTFISIQVPVYYASMYLLAVFAPKISSTFLLLAVPVAFAATALLTFRGVASVGGHGSFLLVFSHIFYKVHARR